MITYWTSIVYFNNMTTYCIAKKLPNLLSLLPIGGQKLWGGLCKGPLRLEEGPPGVVSRDQGSALFLSFYVSCFIDFFGALSILVLNIVQYCVIIMLFLFDISSL